MPQLFIQLIFSFHSGFGIIAILSFAFSILSIVLSLLEYLTTKGLLAGNIILVKFEYESPVLMNMNAIEFDKFVARPHTLGHAIATTLSITGQNVEVVKPHRTPHGAVFVVLIRTNVATKANEIIRLLNYEASTMETLLQCIERAYPKLKASKAQTMEQVTTNIKVVGDARRLIFEQRRLSIRPSTVQMRIKPTNSEDAIRGTGTTVSKQTEGRSDASGALPVTNQ